MDYLLRKKAVLKAIDRSLDGGVNPEDVLFALGSIFDPYILLTEYERAKVEERNRIHEPDAIFADLSTNEQNHLAAIASAEGKVPAIKQIRLLTGMGLADAKHTIEKHFADELEQYYGTSRRASSYLDDN